MGEVGAVEVALGRGSGFLLPSDLELPVPPPDWVALLPGLDPTVMGWKERDWFLGPHARALFDRNGNAGPTIWFNGRVVGGWAQRRDGAVAARILEPVPPEAEDRIAAEAERLTAFLGAVRVTPRFRTPLEKGLAG